MGAFLDVDALGGQQAIAQHIDRQLAGGARVDRHRHGVAGGVFRLVDRGFQQVRRVGAAVRVPADVELHRGHRTIGIGRFDVEPVTTRLRLETQTQRLVGREIGVAIGHAAGRLDRLILPGRILPVPLIARLQLQQLVAQPVAWQLLAVGRDEHDIELGLVTLGDALVAEQRLDADQRGVRSHRQHDLALDRTAAALRHADEDLGLLRPGRGRHLLELHREGRSAIGIGLRQILDRRPLIARGLLVVDAELVTGIARPAAGRRCDQHIALELQTRGRRAIEEMAADLKFHWNFSFDHLLLAGQIEFNPFRDVILDHEGGLADRRALGIGEDARPPGAGRHRRVQRHRQHPAAGALVGQHGAAELDAIGPFDHHGQWRAGQGVALAVAQQRGQIDRLVGAVDTALGVDERVGARRDRPARDTTVGKVEGIGLQAQERVVGFLARHREQRRRQPALAPRQPLLEQHVAGRIGLAGGQDLVVAGNQLHFGVGDCLG